MTKRWRLLVLDGAFSDGNTAARISPEIPRMRPISSQTKESLPFETAMITVISAQASQIVTHVSQSEPSSPPLRACP